MKSKKQTDTDRPICPDCKHPMQKQSKRFTSPDRQVQRWMCNRCGKTAQTIIEGKGK